MEVEQKLSIMIKYLVTMDHFVELKQNMKIVMMIQGVLTQIQHQIQIQVEEEAEVIV